MGDKWVWEEFVAPEAQEVRREFLQHRIQVLADDLGRDSDHLSQVGRTSHIDRAWFRGLGLKRMMIVRGAAASLDSRKAVLIGDWAAAQWGMWFLRPSDMLVRFALPSGHEPPKAARPPKTVFNSTRIPDGDIVTLDGIRVTHPLRTYMDLCRMRQRTSARLVVAWLMQRGVTADEISRYAANFEGKIHTKRKRVAQWLPYRVVSLPQFEYSMAHALLDDARVPLRTNCTLDDKGRATLLAGDDLIIRVGTDPLRQSLESSDEAKYAAALRHKDRWSAARGFRSLYFTPEEIEADPEGFVHEVLSLRYIRDNNLRF